MYVLISFHHDYEQTQHSLLLSPPATASLSPPLFTRRWNVFVSSLLLYQQHLANVEAQCLSLYYKQNGPDVLITVLLLLGWKKCII